MQKVNHCFFSPVYVLDLTHNTSTRSIEFLHRCMAGELEKGSVFIKACDTFEMLHIDVFRQRSHSGNENKIQSSSFCR